MELKKNRVVIDTSIWLLACARKTTGDAMSRVDRQINEASASQNPKKYRGFLARMLVTHEVIVPTKVLKELQEIKQTGILDREQLGDLGKIVHDGNKQDLQILMDAMEGRTTDALPTREQVIRQADIWKRIKMSPDQKKWVAKFQPNESMVMESANKARGIGEEPWLRARKEWRARLEQKDLSPQTIQEAKEWKSEMEKHWPRLVPDYEILLVAEKANAPVASRDADYLLMWKACPELEKRTDLIPILVRQTNDTQFEEISIQKLANTTRENIIKLDLDMTL